MKGYIILGVVILVIIILVSWIIKTYNNLVQLRNKIYGTNETLEEQIANAATTKGPQYKVTVKATTN